MGVLVTMLFASVLFKCSSNGLLSSWDCRPSERKLKCGARGWIEREMVLIGLQDPGHMKEIGNAFHFLFKLLNIYGKQHNIGYIPSPECF